MEIDNHAQNNCSFINCIISNARAITHMTLLTLLGFSAYTLYTIDTNRQLYSDADDKVAAITTINFLLLLLVIIFEYRNTSSCLRITTDKIANCFTKDNTDAQPLRLSIQREETADNIPTQHSRLCH